jgi:MoxR-like ATPase
MHDTTATQDSDLIAFRAQAEALAEAVGQVVFGQDRTVRLMLTCLMSGGHALLEGVPGTAKTLLARSVAAALDARFKRIQFTPDLMPSDIVGTHIFDPQTQDFRMRQGPVFTDILLADEINRTPPKTQAALLEVMEERKATVDGEPIPVSPVFTVFATQNPLEFEGTYPLPEAQLDRFMMKIEVPYLPAEQEVDVLRRYSAGRSAHEEADQTIRPVLDVQTLHASTALLAKVHVDESILLYVQSILAATRDSAQLLLGAGTRAGLHLLIAARAWALLGGRDFVTPDDIKDLAVPVLAHRLILQADAQVDGVGEADVLNGLLSRVEVPK